MYLILAVTTILTGFFVWVSVIPWLRELLIDHDVAPDKPWPFGYRTAWLAIRTTDSEAVIDTLGLAELQCVNWRTGIATTYDEDLGSYYVFVSPPVGEWTFVVGLALPHPVNARFIDGCMPLLTSVAARFYDVQYFFTYPVIEHYAWSRFEAGKLQRAFAWGDEGVIWNKGPLTQEERDLGLKVFELRRLGGTDVDNLDNDDDAGYPREDHVLKIASAWSLDPTKIDHQSADTALGFVGQVPNEWRIKRTKPRKRSRKRQSDLRPVT